jgi:peptidoglycan/xylan/chitin deacetylase (PgdA/CDA1 family)
LIRRKSSGSCRNIDVIIIIKAGTVLIMASILLVSAFLLRGSGSINIINNVNSEAFALGGPSALSSDNSSCENNVNGCVIFRVDNIQDWWERDVQTAVLDTFLQTRTKATPAVVMSNYGNDTNMVDKIKQGEKAGLFEVALQGWGYDDYGLKSFDEQKAALTSANERLGEVNNGVRSNIFVPPYDSINQDTVYVMKQLGFTVLSADYVAHHGGYLPASFPNRTSLGITSIPFTVNFIDDHRPPSSNGKTMEGLVGEINLSIAKHGYAVVLAQPADFALYGRGISSIGNTPIIEPKVNSTQINTLRAVIAQLKASGKTITSFNEVAGLPRAVWPAEKPTTKTELPSVSSPSPSSQRQQQQSQPLLQELQDQQPPKPILDDYKKPGNASPPKQQSSSSLSSSSSPSSPMPSLILQIQRWMQPLITAAATATVLMVVFIAAIVIIVIVVVSIAIRHRRSSSLPALPHKE